MSLFSRSFTSFQNSVALRMLGLRRCSHGVTNQLLLSLFRSLSLSSSTGNSIVTGTSHTHSIVDFLINSLGFSFAEAIAASRKVPRLNSLQNPISILNLFKQYNLDKTHIRSFVSSVPKVLNRKCGTLEPKLRVLHDIGLSGSDLAKFICKDPCFLSRGFDSHILPTISYLRQLLGSDVNVVEAIKKSERLLSPSTLKHMPANVLLLRNYGFSDEKIVKFMIQKPRIMMQKVDWLEEKLNAAEQLGIPRESKMFCYGLHLVASLNELTREKKFSLFRNFGWSDMDILGLIKVSPLCLTLSEAKLERGLRFLMEELGYTADYLARRPYFLSLSLEKRVIPRNNVLKILKENKLVKSNLNLSTIVAIPELRFVNGYVTKFKDEIPDLCEIYATSKEQ